jgi:hypothetical protein
MLEVVRELVDAVAGLRGISGNRAAELHAQLDQAAEPEPEPAPAKPKPEPVKADVPSGA